jgi:hypothetical protein
LARGKNDKDNSMISTAIITVLRLNADVLSVFGNRIFGVVVPQGETLPCLTYTVTSHSQDETSSDPDAYTQVSVKIGVYASTYTDCETYHEYVYTALQNYKGTQDGTVIKTITCENKQSDDIVEQYWVAENSSGQYAYLINMDFSIYIG